MESNRIPKEYRVGGQRIEVRMVDRCDGNSIGMEFLASGYIEIAHQYNKDRIQSEDSKVNTFYHELTHTILGTMGKKELNEDEEFVNTFASFLTEALTSAIFAENKCQNDFIQRLQKQ